MADSYCDQQRTSQEPSPARTGPLAGFKIIEFVGIGAAPMCGMLLADAGAEVLRIDRPHPSGLGIKKPVHFDLLARGRRSVAIDLKHPKGIKCVFKLIESANALIEGFRPNTMERLGLGPEPCLSRNPRLIYGRVTGWGQSGPLAMAAGHDLNYIALAGVLSVIGRTGSPPTPPLNLIADYGGGGLLLAFGITCALLEAQHSGRGQVVDTAMVDGAAILMTSIFGLHAAGVHSSNRGTNHLDSGAPYYEVYECLDGKYVAVAPIEPKFRENLVKLLGLEASIFSQVDNPDNWTREKEILARRFAEKTREEWCVILEGTDACFAPVLTMEEAPHHEHNKARGTFVTINGVVQPAPAPRFSRTNLNVPTAPEAQGASTVEALLGWGISHESIDELQQVGAIGLASTND